MEIPDLWLVIRIEGNPDYHKIVASYYGSYLGGDSWRINSGIKFIEELHDHYLIYGYSGSVYKCYKNNYGGHSTTQGLLENLIKNNPVYVLSQKEFEEYNEAKH